MALKISDPWWSTDSYEDDTAVPFTMLDHSGPHSVALVKTWRSGQTSAGWGMQGKNGAPGFMELYNKDVTFNQRRILHGYNQDKWSFAFVMRSVNVVAIDIDGKNGGLDHAEELLAGAPATLSETSKSGNGYHLYYYTDDTWDETEGFGAYADHIGIVQGVDIRGVGCVYHHNTQRWNNREMAKLPQHIADRLKQKSARRQQMHTHIEKVLETEDIEEILIMQDDILEELAKPITIGKRNNTLFAIGQKLKKAQISDWPDKLAQRAQQLGLAADEADKLVNNVRMYE